MLVMNFKKKESQMRRTKIPTFPFCQLCLSESLLFSFRGGLFIHQLGRALLAHLPPGNNTSRENCINSDHHVKVIFTPSPSVTIGGSTKERLSLNCFPLESRGNAKTGV
ncbi:hypothetical protein AVEN_67881-1 [Araneus ventricosus]|uniref:Uncharacterized protein n=1 Tax=Araneus ventricosus TaxID=182803 RepID=A0A4Y2HWV4_ARAVE|nr:hypothetical protein AVEN_67881-1 [Araneus ventricosus]